MSINEQQEPEHMTGSKALLEIHNNTWMAEPSVENKGNEMNTTATETANAVQSMICDMNKLTFPATFVDVSEIKRDNISLTYYLRVGDAVVMHMDAEARGWGRKDVPDGTVGVVVGFTRYDNYRARIGDFGYKPGKYECNGAAVVIWSDGSSSTQGGGDIRFFENHEEKMKLRREDKAYNEAFQFDTWIEELPELPFWELDVVRIVGRNSRHWPEHKNVKITKIDYRRINDKRNDGSPMPIYDVTPMEKGHGTSCFETDELVLVERGNLWKWFNGQRDQIVWESLEEEIAFHQALGNMTTQVWCAQSDNYNWPLSAVLPALKSGEIDVLSHFNMFGSNSHSAYKIHDPDLAARARARAIEGFSQDVKVCIEFSKWEDEVNETALRAAIRYGVPLIVPADTRGLIPFHGFKELNIPVLLLQSETKKIIDERGGKVFAELPESYIFFSYKPDPLDLPKNITVEIPNYTDQEKSTLALISALGGPFGGGGRKRRETTRLRVQSNTGWSEKNRDLVIAACKQFDLTFVDRAGIADDVMKEAGVNVFQLPAGEKVPFSIRLECDGYVYFTHRGMDDLPFDSTITGFNEA